MLGELVTQWSVIDFYCVDVIARLGRAPDFLGLAMVGDLGFIPRLAAMRNLLEIHEARYLHRFVSAAAIETARQVIRELERHKSARNHAAHAIWLRLSDDTVFGFKPRGKQITAKSEPKVDEGLRTIDSLRDDVRALAPIIVRLEGLLSELPEVDEITGPA